MTDTDRTKLEQLRDACDAALKGEEYQVRNDEGDWVIASPDLLPLHVTVHTNFRPKPKPRRIWMTEKALGYIGTSLPANERGVEFVEVLK